jgi:hypothetical protein
MKGYEWDMLFKRIHGTVMAVINAMVARIIAMEEKLLGILISVHHL